LARSALFARPLPGGLEKEVVHGSRW